MKKPMQVMNDPNLDRIFTEAFTDTMQRVESRERDKQVKDHIDAFSRLFEEELMAKDLTAAERKEFLDAFKSYVANAERNRALAAADRRRKFWTVFGSVVSTIAVVVGIYVWTARPFTPITQVEEDLNEYLMRVDEGYGAYSKRYYRLLDTFERRLGPESVTEYESMMHTELDEQFDALIERLENGEVAYLDDARKWAKYFPDPEEQEARREMAGNAFSQGLGKTVGDSLNTIKEGARGLIDRAAEIIEEKSEQ